MNAQTINLLPIEARREFSGEIARRLIVFYGTALFVLVGLLAVELVAVRLALEIEERSLNAGEAFRGELEEFRTLARKAQETTDMLTVAERFLIRTPPAAAFLEEILAASPHGATVSRVDFRRPQKTLEVAGRMPTRSALLAFEGALRGLASVEQVELPLASLAKPRDLDFVMTIHAR